ncbi:hypothetical protein ABZ896_03995 [Streptomyces sp. NPDC047072]|uniref:hypothetical protein n=1 Tax=Streptomyces sp. NPDC047072 TaxID=3154809 RepID=UPI003410C58D
MADSSAGTPDILFDYAEIGAATASMSTKLSDISSELTSLETTVSNLLQDGLVFEKASVALKDAYDNFSTQMKESASNIKSYADAFDGISDAIAESDTTMANDIIAAQQG